MSTRNKLTNLTGGDVAIKTGTEVRYQGVLINSRLNYKKHVKTVNLMLAKFISSFYRLRFNLNNKRLVYVLRSYV